jgi:hypothetical protein
MGAQIQRPLSGPSVVTLDKLINLLSEKLEVMKRAK